MGLGGCRGLTILLSVIGPLRTVVGVVCRDAELEGRHTGQVLVVYTGGAQPVSGGGTGGSGGCLLTQGSPLGL